jgi:hypothetical protein
MSNYVFAFRGRSDRTAGAEEEAAWGAWFQELGGAVSDFGHRVGRVSRLGSSAAGDMAGEDVLSGYVVVAADSFESAVAMAKGCPGLQHGGSVEIGETVETS